MNLDDEMLRWSQTVYGVVHSLNIAQSVKLGNLTTIIESLSAAENWNTSDLGFNSSVPAKEFKDGSIRLDGTDHVEVFAVLAENVVKVLFINLAVLADECLCQLIQEAGETPPNYLTSKAEWVKSKIDSKFKWAANGLLELCAIRNALVHNSGVLNSKAIKILKIADVDVTGQASSHQIRLSFGDLFRYRRALRTVFGELQKMRR